MCCNAPEATACRSRRARPTSSQNRTTGANPKNNKLLYGSNMQRGGEIKSGSLVDGGIEINDAAVLLNDQARDGQAQAVAAHARLQGVVRLVKALKNVLAIFRRDAVAGIYDRDHHKLLIVWLRAQCNGAAGRREFNGVDDQVVKHL